MTMGEDAVRSTSSETAPRRVEFPAAAAGALRGAENRRAMAVMGSRYAPDVTVIVPEIRAPSRVDASVRSASAWLRKPRTTSINASRTRKVSPALPVPPNVTLPVTSASPPFTRPDSFSMVTSSAVATAAPVQSRNAMRCSGHTHAASSRDSRPFRRGAAAVPVAVKSASTRPATRPGTIEVRKPSAPATETVASSGRSPVKPTVPAADAVAAGAVIVTRSMVARPRAMATVASRASVKGTSRIVTVPGSMTSRASRASTASAVAVPDTRRARPPVILRGSSGRSHVPSVCRSGAARSENAAGFGAAGAWSRRQPAGKYSATQLSGRSPDADSGPPKPRPANRVSHRRPSRDSTVASTPSITRLPANAEARRRLASPDRPRAASGCRRCPRRRSSRRLCPPADSRTPRRR